MPAEFWALSAALCYALSHIAVKFATQTGNMILGLLITLATGMVALGSIAVTTVDTWAVPFGPVVFFALAGLAGPGAGRIVSMRAVRDVGASITVPVQSSSNPAISSTAGVLLFDEEIGLGKLLAFLLIVTGIWVSVRGGPANRGAVVDLQEKPPPRRHRLVLLLPLVSGAAYAASDILRKVALADYGDVVIGAFIGTVVAFAVWLVIFLTTLQFRAPVRMTPSVGWFCVSGVLSSGAQLSLLSALNVGELSAVAPIVASQPVMVIVLSALILRHLERLRMGTVAGAVIVFFGVAYLAVT